MSRVADFVHASLVIGQRNTLHVACNFDNHHRQLSRYPHVFFQLFVETTIWCLFDV